VGRPIVLTALGQQQQQQQKLCTKKTTNIISQIISIKEIAFKGALDYFSINSILLVKYSK